MKILNKILALLFLVGAFALTSCGDNEEYASGAQTNENGLNVGFEDAGNLTIPVDGNSVTLKVVRNKDTGDLSVPLCYYNTNAFDESGNPIFSGPSSVDFKAGELEKDITLTASKSIEMYKDYKLLITIPEEYTNQYATNTAETVPPRANLTIVWEDYKPFAKGHYTSEFFGDDDAPYEEDAILEYSEILKAYRLKNIAGTFTFSFEMDKDNKIKYTDNQFSTGMNYDKYTIYATPSENEEYPTSYDAAVQTFKFGFEFIVKIGSFGNYFDTFQITEKY